MAGAGNSQAGGGGGGGRGEVAVEASGFSAGKVNPDHK